MNNGTTQKFFLYARKSTDVEDKQVLSIEAQLTELREYAAREKLFVVEELIEKQSAKIPGRPLFNLMLERIEKEEASGIVSWHPDRLARNSVDGGKLIYLIDAGKIMALKFPQFWFEATPQGKFMLNIAFGQSKYFVDSLSENTKRGLCQKVRRGEMPGLVPVGYINDSRTKTIVVDKRKAPIVKQTFEMFATGNYRILDIADFLAKNGLISKTGNNWKIDRVSRQILSNPFYYGHFRYLREIHEGVQEPIITKKLFDAVQLVLNKRSKPWSKPRVPKPYLGLFRCGECGMMITAEQKLKYYKHTDHHATYTYYRCTKKSKRIKCNQCYTRQELLDSQVSEMIGKVSLRQDWAKEMLKKLDGEKIELAHSCGAFVGEKREEIRAINSKLQRLLDSYLDQDVDRESYLTKKENLLSSKKTLEEQIARIQQSHHAWLEPMRNWVIEAADAANIASGKDLEAKKVLAQKIFGSNLILSDQKAQGDALIPWAALCAAPPTRGLERVRGIEPLYPDWQPGVLPLYYTRFCAEDVSRTHIACSSDRCLDHLGYLSNAFIIQNICL